MPGIRELLAVALGICLGVVLVAAPRTALRLSVFLGPQRRHRGHYGTDNDIPEMWAWIVRALGFVCIAVAAFIASQAYA
ncbi:hypothetical protein SAMN04487948_114112 [Halogranum amylolyticum]|uniref:DUF6199 domain-containing protein n=1 Tax=Halogranum amylolyticum TaxID=660520 RepID=A0A1H8V794_9EURY|nr:hypothetical protein SAMN04487948_114112 [Halogranum amylolyticum]